MVVIGVMVLAARGAAAQVGAVCTGVLDCAPCEAEPGNIW